MRHTRAIVSAASLAGAVLALTACQSAASSTSDGTGGNAVATTGPGTAVAWTYTMASPTHDESPKDTLAVQYPVVSYTKATPEDTKLAASVNLRLKNVDEAIVTQFRSQFINPVPVTVNGKPVPSQLQITAHASQVGELLSVRYDAFLDRSGSASGYSEEQALTIRMDTGATLMPSDVLSSQAMTTPGQTALAALIAPALNGDYIFGGQSATTAVGSALATMNTPVDGLTDPVVTVTPAGLDFTFQQGAITPMSNGTPESVVPFDKLSGLINPDVTALIGTTPK